MQEHGDAEMGPTKSSHALEYYSRYGKMKDLKNMIIDYWYESTKATTQH